jgi:septum formation protein
VRPAHVDESLRPDEDPVAHARRLASAKARAVSSTDEPAVVLASDTVVSVDGVVYGKPRDEAHARGMLATLSGRWHRVVTAVAAVDTRAGLCELCEHATTDVRFAELTDEEIEAYASSGEPMDKAGAYAIQGAAGWFVEEVRGSVTNVIGLPLEIVRRVFRAFQLPAPPMGPAAGDRFDS